MCGDLLVLAEGDAVGADARLVRAATLFVQEASLTGESEPVLKDAATLAGAVPVADQRNMVFKGTAVVRGSGLALVTATGMDTQMGAIAALLERTEEEPTPLQREVARIGRMLGAAVLIIALIVVASVVLQSEIRGAGDLLDVLLLGAGVIGLQTGGATLVLPLLATQILWINLLTDSWPAMAMGVDPHADEVMARPPRRADQRVIDVRMWVGVVQMGLVMALATLLTIDLFLPGGLIEGSHALETARTAGFTVLVLAQLFNCLNARSALSSAFHRPFANPWLWAAIGLSALLQGAVVHVELLNRAFGTVPLSAEQWLVCLAMASTVLWFGELQKALLRLRRPSAPASFSAHERHH